MYLSSIGSSASICTPQTDQKKQLLLNRRYRRIVNSLITHE